jgi:hypothetical protein
MQIAVPDDGVFTRVERILLTKYQSYWNSLMHLPTRKPLQVAYYQSKEFADAVDRLLPTHDAVFCHLVRTAEYVRDKRIPKFLEMTDAISLN